MAVLPQLVYLNFSDDLEAHSGKSEHSDRTTAVADCSASLG